MSKFRIEIPITILSIIIGAAMVASGYFVYKSLSKIVYSIHQEATPDYQLFLIKDLASDLASLENNARLYILTKKSENLEPYDTLRNQITSKIYDLNQLQFDNKEDAELVDSLSNLAIKKVELWQSILDINQSSQNLEPAFSELYSKLNEQKPDTIKTETEKKGLLRSIFGGKKTVVDTTIVQRDLKTDEIKQEIQNLQTEIKEKGEEKNILESQLIEENIALVKKINALVIKAEELENNKLVVKTNEANHLANLTYTRIAIFTIVAVLLLLVVLFLLFNQLRRMRTYQKVLKDAKLEAENLAAAKEKFAANVSHELRTPANAIYGLTEQLIHSPLDKNSYELVTVLSKSASHLKNVINNTLDFSKIQANKLKLEKTDFSPSDVFNEVLALQRFDAYKNNVKLNFDWQGDKPEALLGDPLRLKQILINLLGNAIKFTQKGEVSLEVNSIKNKNNTYNFKITVSDTGIGISQENLKRVFDEYVQIENLEGIKYQGTGLGLSIVKKLVELHGGTISVESKTGKGTEIKLIISYPVGKKENLKEEIQTQTEVPIEIKNLTIMIADDEEFNRFLLKGIFKKWGVKYIEGSNGNEVVGKSLTEDIDVILMDLRMPGKNGFEAAKAILKLKPEIKIVAVSASNEEIDKENCKKAGMHEFLSKPFSEQDLINTLISILKINFETTKKENQKTTVLDLSELKRLSGDDENFLNEMILLFIKSSESGLIQIQDAIKSNDIKQIKETLHKMAAPCKHLHATQLYDKIKKLEILSQDQNNINMIKSSFPQLSEEVEETIAYLKNYLNNNTA